MAHSSYRKYNNIIIDRYPFLVNRPPLMVKHCLNRISKACRSDKSGITELGKSESICNQHVKIFSTDFGCIISYEQLSKFLYSIFTVIYCDSL